MGNCCSLGTDPPPPPSPPPELTNSQNTTPAAPVMIPPDTPPILATQELDSTAISQTLDHISDREGLYMYNNYIY